MSMVPHRLLTPEGVFTTPYGTLQYTYYQREVRIRGTVTVAQYQLDTDFWMRRNEDNDWVGAGTHGKAVLLRPDGKELQANDPDYPGLNQAEIKLALTALRDSWRDFMRHNPQVHLDAIRAQTQERLDGLRGERHALERMIRYKDDEIALVAQVAASEDPVAAWKEAGKNWPKSPWNT